MMGCHFEKFTNCWKLIEALRKRESPRAVQMGLLIIFSVRQSITRFVGVPAIILFCAQLGIGEISIQSAVLYDDLQKKF